MFMHKKLIFTLLLISCIFLSISFVSANNLTDDNSNTHICDDSIVINTQNKSFKDLDNEINGDLNKSEIFLNDDYFYQKEGGYNKILNFNEGIFINRSVTINGLEHLIDANHSSRIFYINADNIVLKNIIFKNGCSDIGGAIYCNASNITIINCTFINNWVFNFEGGAAITYKYDGTIINSTFNDNYVFEIDNTGLSAVALNIHNESISCAVNCGEVYDSVSFDKNYNVTIIKSTFANAPTYPIVFEYLVPNPDNNSSDAGNLSDKSNSSKIVKKIKSSPKLIAKNKVFNKKTKIKNYSVILKNNKSKAMKNKWITLKVKGKLFKAKTNKNGKAVFKIKKLNKKGNYKAIITFKGDKIYNKVSKKIKIIIK